jgi:hypothetical protein
MSQGRPGLPPPGGAAPLRKHSAATHCRKIPGAPAITGLWQAANLATAVKMAAFLLDAMAREPVDFLYYSGNLGTVTAWAVVSATVPGFANHTRSKPWRNEPF